MFFQIIASVVVAAAVKDTRREKAPSNNTPALMKCMNMGIWVVAT